MPGLDYLLKKLCLLLCSIFMLHYYLLGIKIQQRLKIKLQKLLNLIRIVQTKNYKEMVREKVSESRNI
jgi:hypothetical protein